MKLREFLEKINKSLESQPELLDYNVSVEHDTFSTRQSFPVTGINFFIIENDKHFLIMYYAPESDF